MKKRQAIGTVTSIDPSLLQLFAITEVARLLSVGRTTVYALINQGEIQAMKIGSARRVLATSLSAYIQRQTDV